MGITAFRAEKQHEVEPPPGGMFDHLEYQHCDWDEVPDLVRKVVWVDPAVTDTDQSDAHGIQADGIDANGKIYRLYSWEQRTSPRDVMRRAIRKAKELGAIEVGVETDQGGDTWKDTYAKAVDELVEAGELERHEAPKFKSEKAGGKGSKVERANQMLAAYERAEIVHVRGTHKTLEAALRRFPITKPFDLTDAAFWSWYDLKSKKPRKVVVPYSMEQENRWEMGV
jgi:phage terminase large subunit-like protein